MFFKPSLDLEFRLIERYQQSEEDINAYSK